MVRTQISLTTAHHGDAAGALRPHSGLFPSDVPGDDVSDEHDRYLAEIYGDAKQVAGDHEAGTA